MKTENKKKSQKKIQIKGTMPLSVHFFRDAEAVSYTHLDVYKRQVRERVRQFLRVKKFSHFGKF